MIVPEKCISKNLVNLVPVITPEEKRRGKTAGVVAFMVIMPICVIGTWYGMEFQGVGFGPNQDRTVAAVFMIASVMMGGFATVGVAEWFESPAAEKNRRRAANRKLLDEYAQNLWFPLARFERIDQRQRRVNPANPAITHGYTHTYYRVEWREGDDERDGADVEVDSVDSTLPTGSVSGWVNFPQATLQENGEGNFRFVPINCLETGQKLVTIREHRPS